MNDMTKLQMDRQTRPGWAVLFTGRGMADYEVEFNYITPRGSLRKIPISVNVFEQEINVPATGSMPPDVIPAFLKAIKIAEDLANREILY